MERTVLITGCSSGIGRATSEKFLRRGWTVYATARDTDDIEDLGQHGARTVELDVTKEDDVENAVETVVENDGRLDCVVNNVRKS